MSSSQQEIHQLKLSETQLRQAQLTNMQTDLGMPGVSTKLREKLSAADAQFISDLGWLSTASVAVAASI